MPSFDPDALRSARLRAGLTQHELAVLIGVGGGERISIWELGTAHPRPASITKLAAALHTSTAELLGEDQTNTDLRGLRLAQGLSAHEVSDRLNVSVATYRRWEAGRNRGGITDAVIADLARALRVPRRAVRGALEVAPNLH